MFLDEAQEQLESLNRLVLHLEKLPADVDAVNEIFRVMHTLKGMSATMGFSEFKQLTHKMEDIFGVFKTQAVAIESDDIDLLFLSLDKLSSYVQGLKNNDTQLSVAGINALIPKLTHRFDVITVDTQITTCNLEELGSLDKVIALNQSMKDEKNERVFSNDVRLDTKIELSTHNDAEEAWLATALSLLVLDNPETGTQEAERHVYHVKVHFHSNAALGAVRAYMLHQVFSKEPLAIHSTYPFDMNTDFMSDDQDVVAHWLVSSVDLDQNDLDVLSQHRVADVVAVRVEEIDLKASTYDTAASSSQTRDNAGVESSTEGWSKQSISLNKTVRIPMDRIDSVVNLVRELVIDRTRLDQYANVNGSDDLLTVVSSLTEITNELQELVMKFRMEPISQMFNLLPRAIRDLSKSLNKPVSLSISGEDTEVDRVVNEELSGALIHLIRNALDHGIENAEERHAKGKPEQGVIAIEAVNVGDSITIKITDDGKGLDRDIILNKAISKQLVQSELASTMLDSDVFQLICLPGFSTAEITTEVSGRGVGMDVVKSSVTKLGGGLCIVSEIDKGTTIEINLPTNMAIIDVLLIKVFHSIYALPLSTIIEVVECPMSSIRRVQNTEMVIIRGNPIPLIRLAALFNVEDSNKPQGRQHDIICVVVNIQNQYYCLEVSSLIGQQEAVVKPLPTLVSKNKCFSGVMTLGNGDISLIINPVSLVNKKNRKHASFIQ